MEDLGLERKMCFQNKMEFVKHTGIRQKAKRPLNEEKKDLMCRRRGVTQKKRCDADSENTKFLALPTGKVRGTLSSEPGELCKKY